MAESVPPSADEGLFLLVKGHFKTHPQSGKSGAVAHAYVPSTRETEAEGLLRVHSQPGLQSKTLSKKNNKNKKVFKKELFGVF